MYECKIFLFMGLCQGRITALHNIKLFIRPAKTVWCVQFVIQINSRHYYNRSKRSEPCPYAANQANQQHIKHIVALW